MRSAWRRVVDDERGQSSVLIVSLLMVFMFFTAMVANVGQAVNRRIALQIVADAGAWTGATNQAIGLNKLAELNLYLQEFWTVLTQTQQGFTLPVCETAIPALSIYQALTPVVQKAITVINKGYPFVAYREAIRVTNYNLEDLFPGEDKTSFTMAGPGAVPGLSSLATMTPVLNGTVPSTPGWMSPARWAANWACINPGSPLPQPMAASFFDDLWKARLDTGATDFWWYVKAPATRALLFDELFGPNAIPEMEAASAAKPVGGSILWGQQQYVTKLVPVASAVANDIGWWWTTGSRTGDAVEDTYRGITRVVTH